MAKFTRRERKAARHLEKVMLSKSKSRVIVPGVGVEIGRWTSSKPNVLNLKPVQMSIETSVNGNRFVMSYTEPYAGSVHISFGATDAKKLR